MIVGLMTHFGKSEVDFQHLGLKVNCCIFNMILVAEEAADEVISRSPYRFHYRIGWGLI